MLNKALQREKSKPRLLPIVYSPQLFITLPAALFGRYSLYSHQNYVVSKHSKALSGILTCWSYLGVPGSFILQELSNSEKIQMISEEPGTKISGSKFIACFSLLHPDSRTVLSKAKCQKQLFKSLQVIFLYF